MANQEQLDILRQGADKWNEWKKVQYRKSYKDIDIDLSGAELSYAHLSKAELTNADMSNAKIIHAYLDGANLKGANLRGADLSGAELSIAHFNSAVLSGAILRETMLNETDLSGANFTLADLSGADFSDADFSDAIVKGANLRGAIFNNATLAWTVLGDVDLSTVKGLERVAHMAPSTIGIDTLEHSQGNIPEVFLRGVGLSDTFIEYARALVQKPIDYYTCFISYSSKDEAFAKRLHNDLQGEGVRCWFAPEDMDVGDKIRHRIDESIRKYDKLLLILSEHSIASTWVAYEVERALNKEPTGIPNVLYPVRLDKAIMTCEKEWAKDIKETRHVGNFEEWMTNHDSYQTSLQRLLGALKSKNTINKGRR